MKINYKRGSEWGKWDLHIHSPETFLNNHYGGCSNKEFIDKVSNSGFSAIGLTNYFKFEDSFWALKKELEDRGIAVFPNLEIRLTYQNKEDQCCDLHIIFSNCMEKTEVDKFLGKLNIKIESGTKIAQDMNDKNDFEKGVVEFDKLIDVLRDPAIPLDFLIAFLSRGSGGSRSSCMYEDVYTKSNLLLHSTDSEEKIEEDRKFWLKYDRPLLQSSDAHKLDDIGTKYTWIKADPTFEGLKQIMYEPEERICIQDLRPDDNKKQSMIIDYIEYSNKDGSDMKKVLFNQNLNSLIGVRGSGKSNLLKNIVYKSDYDEYCARGLKDRNLLELGNFKITWIDGISDSGDRKILFIPQKYLGSKVYEEGDSDSTDGINSFITKLLNGNDNFRDAQEKISQIRLNKNKDISNLIEELLQTRRNIVLIKKDIENLSKKEELEKEIIKNNEVLKKAKNDIKVSSEDLEKYEKSNEEKLKIENEVKQYTKDIDLYDTFIEEDVLSIENAVSKYEFSQSESEKINSYIKQSDIDDKEFIENRKKEISKILTKHKKKIAEINEKNKPIEKKLSKRDDIKEIDERIKKDNKELNNVILFSKKKEKEEKEKEKKEQEIKSIYKETVLTLRKISKGINIELPNTVKIEFELELDKESFNEFLGKLYESDIKEYRKTSNDVVDNVNDIFDGLVSEKIKIKANGDLKGCLIDLFDFRYALNYLNSIQNKEGTSLDDMSAGQKMITLLTLIFFFDKNSYPILIDQPEDDLDSTTISGVVCDFIKSQKKERQIIIASHNANLVIGSDSEGILVASNNKGNFDYQTGSIENPKINKETVRVLEGGKEAFKKRRNRYQF